MESDKQEISPQAINQPGLQPDSVTGKQASANTVIGGFSYKVEDRFKLPSYELRRKIFKLFGGAFHIRDVNGALIFYSKMKAFKLREDIRLYTDESMGQEVLTIQARQIIDFSAAYDILDPTTNTKVGALKRKGFRSMIQDEWIIMDKNDQEIGRIFEESTFLALMRRFVINLIPQTYYVEVGGQRVAKFKGNFNPFVYKLSINFFDNGIFDRRIGLAVAVLLAATEGKQG